MWLHRHEIKHMLRYVQQIVSHGLHLRHALSNVLFAFLDDVWVLDRSRAHASARLGSLRSSTTKWRNYICAADQIDSLAQAHMRQCTDSIPKQHHNFLACFSIQNPQSKCFQNSFLSIILSFCSGLHKCYFITKLERMWNTHQCLLPKNQIFFNFLNMFSEFTVAKGAWELELTYSMSGHVVQFKRHIYGINTSRWKSYF